MQKSPFIYQTKGLVFITQFKRRLL
ncbi:hypothetical protein D046_2785A, partial [Vibrio parahaemolyticus V-223/04]